MLQGARSSDDVETIRLRLSRFGQVSIPDSVWPELGANLSTLRRAGVTVPFPDVLLATVAVHHGLELWTLDKHFALIHRFLPDLRLHLPSE
jgi:predicted nucleic acid-binding protein